MIKDIYNLSDHQKKVLQAFDKPKKDIDIAVLYSRVYGDPGFLTARDMQQKIAPIFSSVNEKLEKGNSILRIQPGITKRTYRLEEIVE